MATLSTFDDPAVPVTATEPVDRDLFCDLLNEAARLGLSERELVKRAAIPRQTFFRWKRGRVGRPLHFRNGIRRIEMVIEAEKARMRSILETITPRRAL